MSDIDKLKPEDLWEESDPTLDSLQDEVNEMQGVLDALERVNTLLFKALVKSSRIDGLALVEQLEAMAETTGNYPFETGICLESIAMEWRGHLDSQR